MENTLIQDALTIWEKEMKVWAKTPHIALGRAFAFPLLWLVIFSNAFGGSITNIPVAMVSYSHGQYSDAFVSSLTSGNTLQVAAYTNYAQALEMLNDKRVNSVILIPEGFDDAFASGSNTRIQMLVDATTPTLSGTLNQFVRSKAASFSNRVLVEHISPQEAAYSQAPSTIEPLQVQEDILFGRGMTYTEFMAAGIVVQVIVFSAIFSGGFTLIMDREFGTLKLMLAAPISKTSIILGKVLSGSTQALFSGILALLLAIALGVSIKTGLVGVIVLLPILAILTVGSIGLATALAARITAMENFMMAMQFIIMPLWFLSGSLYPIQSLPWWLKPLANLNPLTYATDAVRSIMLRGLAWGAIGIDVLVLTLFSGAMLYIGTSVFRRTLD